MRYKIESWTGRGLWPDKTFDSFESGWLWIHDQDPEPEQSSPLWKSGWYDDYYVLPVHECSCELGDCAYHAGYQDGVRAAQDALMERFGIIP